MLQCVFYRLTKCTNTTLTTIYTNITHARTRTQNILVLVPTNTHNMHTRIHAYTHARIHYSYTHTNRVGSTLRGSAEDNADGDVIVPGAGLIIPNTTTGASENKPG